VSFVIPATLQDSLVARLDRLGSAKDVALAASMIGREFPFDILAAVTSLDYSALTAALEQPSGQIWSHSG
jgi:predicted ATPase